MAGSLALGSQYATAAATNRDLALDIRIYNESRAKWDDAHWFAGHRNGQTGLESGQAPNLDLFIAAYDWTVTKLKNGHSVTMFDSGRRFPLSSWNDSERVSNRPLLRLNVQDIEPTSRFLTPESAQ